MAVAMLMFVTFCVIIVLFVRNTIFICYYLSQLLRYRSGIGEKGIEFHNFEDYFQWQVSSTEILLDTCYPSLNLCGKTVVDVGCGYGGRIPYMISNKGAKYIVATDIDPHALEVAEACIKKHFIAEASVIEFRKSDDGGIPLEDRKIDVVIMIDIFEHLAEPERMLIECYRVLKDNGIVYFGTVGWYNYMASHVTDYIPIPWCQVLFSDKVLIECIRRIQKSDSYISSIWDKNGNLRDRWEGISDLRDRPGEYINKLTIRDIRNICKNSPFEIQEFNVLGYRGRTCKWSRVLAPLAKIPLLNEFFHSYVSVILCKSSIT